MFKNISNIKLIAIFAGLVLIYGAIKLWGNSGRSKSFRSELVEFDTAKVSSVSIFNPGDTVTLAKQNGDWKLKLSGGKEVDALDNVVESALTTLQGVTPSRIATRDENKYKDFQVDTTGTRVQVYEGDNKALDLVIGRFGMQGQRQFYTYVKLYEEPEVYAADNFMGMSVATNPAGFRDKKLIEATKDSISAVSFRYPGDSSFFMRKSVEGQWLIDNQVTDSAQVADYLSDLRYATISDFADDRELSDLGNATYRIEVTIKGSEPVVLEAYNDPQYNLLIHSSANPEAIFADADSSSFKDLFLGPGTLLAPEEE